MSCGLWIISLFSCHPPGGGNQSQQNVIVDVLEATYPKQTVLVVLLPTCTVMPVNRMAAGSRLPRSSHGFFLLSPTFQIHLK